MKLASAGLTMLGGLLIAKLVQMFAHGTITNFSNPEVYGVFALLFSLVMFGAVLGTFGMNIAVLRFGPSYVSSGQPRKSLSKLFSSANRISGLASLTATPLVLLAGFLVSLRAESDTSLIPCLVVMAASVPFISLLNVSAFSLRVLEEYWKDLLIRNFLRGTVFLLLTVVAVNQNVLDTSLSVSIAFTLSFFVSFALCGRAVTRAMSKAISSESQPPSTAEIIKFGRRITAGKVFYEVATNVDRIFLAVYLTLEDVGLYSVAFLLARQVETLGATLDSTLLQKFATTEGRKADMKTLWASLFVSICIGLVMIFVLYLIGPTLLGLMGKEYSDNNVEFVLLASGFFLNSMSTPFAAHLQANGYEARDSYCIMFGMCANLVGLSLLVPEFGIRGAAVSTGLSLSIIFLLRIVTFLLTDRASQRVISKSSK